ncbi:hypothetical protein ACFW08_14365 [Streptomyces sp. NPDC058960]|uniref:hypothetical protein n=1 Tax=Streptomyces sp. NPDC058960 TaxID=3346679 RepID=UPI0036BF1155
MRDGFAPTAEVNFSTRRSITTLEAKSLADLADAVADSTEPGNPELLDNLEISINNYLGRGSATPRTVRVSIDGRGVYCHVGGEPSWVRGQIATLRPLIEDTRPFKWPIWYMPTWSFAGYGSSLTLWIALISSFAFTGSGPTSMLTPIATGIVGVIGGLAVGRGISRHAKVEIWLKRDDLPRSFWRLSANEIITAVIAILSLLAVIIFGVITHNDAKADSKSPRGNLGIGASAFSGTGLK